MEVGIYSPFSIKMSDILLSALIYAMEFLEKNIEWLKSRLDALPGMLAVVLSDHVMW